MPFFRGLPARLQAGPTWAFRRSKRAAARRPAPDQGSKDVLQVPPLPPPKGSGVASGTVTSDERRVAARDAVSARTPADDREREARDLILAELERLPAPFSEHADTTHLTASAVVIGPRGTVLHVHRRTGAWLQPGGHIEEGESPADAALRETVEETGLAARHPEGGPVLVHVDVHPAPRGHVHLDLRYLLLAPDDEPCPATGESPEARWFSWEEADAVADESLHNALRAARIASDDVS